MNFCDNLLREILSFLGEDYISYYCVSKQWKSVIRKKMDREETLWNFLFPDFNPLIGCPLNVPMGLLKSDKNIIEKIENWFSKYGTQKYKKYKILALEPPLYCEDTSDKLFTEEWTIYFNSIENRIYEKIPLFKLLGVATDLKPGLYSHSYAEILFLNFKMVDCKNATKIRHINKTKDWMCWERVYDDEEFVGYIFKEQLWKDLEKIYSYISGKPIRALPNMPSFVDRWVFHDSRIDIKKIEEYSS